LPSNLIYLLIRTWETMEECRGHNSLLQPRTKTFLFPFLPREWGAAYLGDHSRARATKSGSLQAVKRLVFAASKPKEGSQEEEGTDLKRRPLAVAGMKKRAACQLLAIPHTISPHGQTKQKAWLQIFVGKNAKASAFWAQQSKKGRRI